MKKLDIGIQNLSKMEGHADLDVKVREGNVQEVKFKLQDNKRFFTQAIRGKSVDVLPQSVSRICGTCSIAHIMCCIESIEKALKVKVSKQTQLLKELTMHGLMIRDHALHVYMFSLPDVFGIDSVLDFKGKQMDLLKDAFDIKRAGSNLSIAVAGKAVHAPFPAVGGYLQVPKKEDLMKVVKELKSIREKVFPVLEVYYKSKIDFSRETNFVALGGKFDYLDEYIIDSKGERIDEEKYLEYLTRVIIPYSQASGYRFEGETYMLGALARLNLNKDMLHKKTKKDAKKYLDLFPSNNIFHNNIAQAIEILHSIDSAIEIIENNEFRDEKPVEIKYRKGVGVGVIEAPRGILFYRLEINEDGTVKEGSLATPTQQNQINIELDVKNFVQKNLDKLKKEEIEYGIEKLIRAYDPCISCATHFLNVNWL